MLLFGIVFETSFHKGAAGTLEIWQAGKYLGERMSDPVQRCLSVGQNRREMLPGVRAAPICGISEDVTSGSLARSAVPSAGLVERRRRSLAGSVGMQSCITHVAPTLKVLQINSVSRNILSPPLNEEAYSWVRPHGALPGTLYLKQYQLTNK